MNAINCAGWPYLEMFVDQTLQHFRRSGLPDIIHGHYADAGSAGAQLARLLHIPFVFTGHSLGRVKRQRLLLGKATAETLEKKYKFNTRIEAEEIALETASMVVTSTDQEVTQQYELYVNVSHTEEGVVLSSMIVTAVEAPQAESYLAQLFLCLLVY